MDFRWLADLVSTFEVLDGAVVTNKYKSVSLRDEPHIYNNKTFSPLGGIIIFFFFFFFFFHLALRCLYPVDVGSVAVILEEHAVFHLQG
jgi:hypothetical protein